MAKKKEKRSNLLALRLRDGGEREYLENLVAEFKEQGKRKRGFVQKKAL